MFAPTSDSDAVGLGRSLGMNILQKFLQVTLQPGLGTTGLERDVCTIMWAGKIPHQRNGIKISYLFSLRKIRQVFYIVCSDLCPMTLGPPLSKNHDSKLMTCLPLRRKKSFHGKAMWYSNPQGGDNLESPPVTSLCDITKVRVSWIKIWQ